MAFSGRDEKITCLDCQQSFDFTARDQRWYAQQNWPDPPKRCKPCRDKRKATRNGGAGGRGKQGQQADQAENFDATWRDDRGNHR